MTEHPHILTLCSTLKETCRFSEHDRNISEPNDGHIWLLLEERGKAPVTFGLWPKRAKLQAIRHPCAAFVEEMGWNGSGTDIQRNVEIKDRDHNVIRQCYSWKLSDKKLKEFMEFIAQPRTYNLRGYNCMDFACEVLGMITGQEIRAQREIKSPSKNDYRGWFRSTKVDYSPYELSAPRKIEGTLYPTLFRDVSAEIVSQKADFEKRDPLPVKSKPTYGGREIRLLSWLMPVLIGVGSKMSKLGAAVPS